jgi:hypothetical protein
MAILERLSVRRILGASGAVIACVALLPAAGIAQSSSKPFTASFSPPATFVPGAASTWHYTITDADHNGVPSNQPLGSAHITIPNAWSVTGVSAAGPTGTTWTADVNAGLIEVDAATQGDRLAGGQSVTVAITATAGCAAPSPSAWPIAVKQSNNFLGTGNDFALDGAIPTLTTSASAGPLGSFTISTSPSPETAGQGFTVTATAFDTCNKVKTDYAPAGLTPTGTLDNSATAPAGDTVSPSYDAFTWSQGVGTATVVPKKEETGRTVTITDGATTATSLPFAVNPGPVAPKFANEPGDSQVSSTIFSNVATGTLVSVNVADAYGNPALDGTTVSMTSSPTGLSGSTSARTTGGVATFGNMSIGSLGTYTLTAQVGNASDTSPPFNIVAALKVCDGVTKCTASASNGNQSADTSMASSTNTPFAGGVVLESTFENVPASCSNFTPIPGTVGTEVQVTTSTDFSQTQPAFTITFTIPKATLKAAGLSTLGAAQFDLCLGAKRLDGGVGGWVTASGSLATLVNGLYWGIVPNASNSLPANNPFISSQHKDGAGNLVIVLVKPYPWDGLGFAG